MNAHKLMALAALLVLSAQANPLFAQKSKSGPTPSDELILPDLKGDKQPAVKTAGHSEPGGAAKSAVKTIPTTQSNLKFNVSRSLPMVSMETRGPTEINIGRQATFTITVRNVGESKAQQVLVQAALPKNTRLATALPQPEIEDGILVFDVGELAAKSKKDIRIDLVPTEKGTVDVAAKVSFAMYTQSVLQVRQPKLELELAAPQEAIYGDTVKLKLTVKNTGDGPAEKIKISQVLPEVSTESQVHHTNAVIKNMPPVIPALAAGETKTIDLEATVKGAGAVRTTLIAESEGGLEVNSTSQIRVRRPLLEVAMEGPKLRYASRTGDYTIELSNPGDAPAENVRITTQIPKGLLVAAIEKRASLDKEKGVLSWTLPVLEPGRTERLKYRVKALTEGVQSQQVVVQADRDLNVQTDYDVKVMGFADILMTVEDTVSPIEVGGTVEFEIRVKNRGTKLAENVEIQSVLPDALEPVPSNNYSVRGQSLVFKDVNTIPAGKEIMLKFQAIGRTAGDHLVKIKLSSSTLTRDVIAEEGTLFYKTDANGQNE